MIPLLYIDDDILAVEKPEGLATIPERGNNTDCLLARIEEEYQQKIFVVHRLDKEVSGVILFARNAAAHRWLCTAFEGRQVEKRYLALVFGAFSAETGEFNQPLREFGSGRMGVDFKKGKPSVTRYKVRERRSAYSLVEAYPHTGRRHQIRVHFYAAGHPIVGDRRYGETGIQTGFARLMLHAESITFPLLNQSSITISSPLPASFTSLLAQCSRSHPGKSGKMF